MKKFEKNYPVYHPNLNESLSDIANVIMEAKQRGTGLYCDMSGLAIMSLTDGKSKTLIICSDDINSLDDVYIAITGLNQEEYKNNLSSKVKEAVLKDEERKRAFEDKDKEIVDKLDDILETGRLYINPMQIDDWEKFVLKSREDIYGRSLLNNVYNILKALGEGKDIKECKQMFLDCGFSGAMNNSVKNIIFRYSPRGLEFYKALSTPKELLTNYKKILLRAKEDKKREQEKASRKK